MAEASVAETFLSVALRDELALRVLAASPGVHDSMVGYHAQQAVEKALKAVLSAADVPFRRTHDIAELLDLLADAGLAVPPHADRLDELNPYAVEARYGMVDPQCLDREETGRMVVEVIEWAREVIRSEN